MGGTRKKEKFLRPPGHAFQYKKKKDGLIHCVILYEFLNRHDDQGRG